MAKDTKDTKELSEVQQHGQQATQHGINPFMMQGESGSGTEVQKQKASQEIQAAIVMAQARPRNAMQAMNRILQSCTRPTLAEQALYAYARGGTEITGPSIRMAEELARNWGNMRFGISQVAREDDHSVMLAYCWDMETNVFASREFHVKHWRDTRSGGYKLTDERDIYELTANMGARRLRACILDLIPGDVVEQAVNQCLLTQQSGTEGATQEQVERLVTAFAQFGVTKEMIAKRVQRRVESITQAQIPPLKRIWQSLRDGMSHVEDWFELPEGWQAPQGTPPQTREAQQTQQAPPEAAPSPPARGKPGGPPPERPPAAPAATDEPEGGYNDGPPVDAKGELWDPQVHATDSETGGPSFNKDGSFRRRRGAGAASQQSGKGAQSHGEPAQRGRQEADAAGPATPAAPDGASEPAPELPLGEAPEPEGEREPGADDDWDEPPEPDVAAPAARGQRWDPATSPSMNFNDWAMEVEQASGDATALNALKDRIETLPSAMRGMASQIIDKKLADVGAE